MEARTFGKWVNRLALFLWLANSVTGGPPLWLIAASLLLVVFHITREVRYQLEERHGS